MENVQENHRPQPKDKIPRPTIKHGVSQLEFDQFIFEWTKYKDHYQLSHDAATSLFFCCTDEVRQRVRVVQSTRTTTWKEEELIDVIKI